MSPGMMSAAAAIFWNISVRAILPIADAAMSAAVRDDFRDIVYKEVILLYLTDR